MLHGKDITKTGVLFVMLDGQGVSQVVPSEGSFFQTENKYQALVYYKERGGRTDRLVGYQQVQYK